MVSNALRSWVLRAAAGGGVLVAVVFAARFANRTPPLDLAPADSAFDQEPSHAQVVLAPRPVTVAPGVHQLGAMFPSAVYAIETTEGLVLVDSGLSEQHASLVRQMSELRLDPSQVRAILLTHAHGDHSLGAMRLKRATGAAIHAGRDDAPVLRAGGPHEAIFSIFEMPGHEMHATEVDVELGGGELLTFGDTRIEVIATPGHTPGSTCYVLDRGGSRIFFGGDTIMSGFELGTYSAYLAPRYRGDARSFLATLRKLSALPAPDIVLPGHPRDDKVPLDPHFSSRRWSSMLERGIRELEELVERYETDGADFLDGNPKEILPGLHYLGDFDGCAVFVLATPSHVVLFDAPGGPGFCDWFESKLRSSALNSRSLTAVLLTSCGDEATSGLAELVERTQCQVVSSESGVERLWNLGVPSSRWSSVDALRAARWFDVETLPVADARMGAMAYIIPWAGKTVLVSGRMPAQTSAAEIESLRRAIAGKTKEINAYRDSLYQLLVVNPDVWLPAKPHQGRNANWYSGEWSSFVSSGIQRLQRLKTD